MCCFLCVCVCVCCCRFGARFSLGWNFVQFDDGILGIEDNIERDEKDFGYSSPGLDVLIETCDTPGFECYGFGKMSFSRYCVLSLT